jgi:3-deoxy-D-manno-octulosonate 8-phosphate phosphatase (KDO 8-P phosphatase)
MKNIKLIILDVDGTLTDGKIYIDNNGVESKTFNVKDGMAIAQAIKYGINVSIITGRESEINNIRSKELGINEIHQSVINKVDKVKEIIKRLDIKLDKVCYVGDDINDFKDYEVSWIFSMSFRCCKACARTSKLYLEL